MRTDLPFGILAYLVALKHRPPADDRPSAEAVVVRDGTAVRSLRGGSSQPAVVGAEPLHAHNGVVVRLT
jgi:hypothetical protein